jgi:hypothetical protein
MRRFLLAVQVFKNPLQRWETKGCNPGGLKTLSNDGEGRVRLEIVKT